MDSSVSPTYGDHGADAGLHGHFLTCYHPLFVFNQFGDLERCALRRGNVHSAREWPDVLTRWSRRYRNKNFGVISVVTPPSTRPGRYEFQEARMLQVRHPCFRPEAKDGCT